MDLEKKYTALLDEAWRRGLPDTEHIHLCFQLLSLASAIDVDCARLLAPHDLSEGRFVVLFLLDGQREGLAPHVLADKAGVTRATMTGLIDGLARTELVVRQADEADRRALRICLTPKGKRLAAKLFVQHGQWIASLFGHLSAAERTLLFTLLDKVATGIAAQRQDKMA
jgi:MarR family transcriptional repressor of emrRAB